MLALCQIPLCNLYVQITLGASKCIFKIKFQQISGQIFFSCNVTMKCIYLTLILVPPSYSPSILLIHFYTENNRHKCTKLLHFPFNLWQFDVIGMHYTHVCVLYPSLNCI